ncbi:hypothetical protein ACFFX0_33410 [Citricoccus parietis]|uniref:Uncharacterized protein n=1 Tax=Citricoccus parietis TaxID=592307 RepID=A0ABV5GA29_9MICC
MKVRPTRISTATITEISTAVSQLICRRGSLPVTRNAIIRRYPRTCLDMPICSSNTATLTSWKARMRPTYRASPSSHHRCMKP